MTQDHSEQLASIGERALDAFTDAHSAREEALRLSREVVRTSANAIRAAHRGELDRAKALLEDASGLVSRIAERLAGHPAIFYAGYVEDAHKEYAEANATLAFTGGAPLPGPGDLGVGTASYMNGLAEAASELRRYILDSLRRDDFSRCEDLLGTMDEVYSLLVTIDYPDALTRGLRRNTDMLRSVLERTRGDLTLALRQRRLEERLSRFQDQTGNGGA